MKIVHDKEDTLVWLRSENPADWPQGGQVLTKLRNIFEMVYEDFPTVGHIRRRGERIKTLEGLGRVTYEALIRRLDETHPSKQTMPPDIAIALDRLQMVRLQLDQIEEALRSMGRFVGTIKDKIS
jgi:hypothetical protein